MKKIILLAFLCISIATHAQQPKGDRTLAWQVDMAENLNYDSAFAYAQNGCLESVHLFMIWNSIQPDTNTFDPAVIANFLDIINIYYPATGSKAELQIAVMNTASITTPSELENVDFDDPRMIRRFKILLDTVFTHIPDLELVALNIGNEADIHMGVDATKYKNFRIFLDSVSTYAKQLYFNLHGSDLNVGTTFTFHGLTDVATMALCQSVNASRDIITTTYYPLESDFTMKSPSAVNTDFGYLVNLYSDTTKPIYFAECGYSSSDICNSSEEQQALFYTHIFEAWDTYRANIKYLTIFKSNDWSHAETASIVADPAYGGITDTTFYEYLRTLGVRTWDGDGTSKKAYHTIRCELEARNWCNEANCILTSIEEEAAINKSVQLYPNPGNDFVTLKTDVPVRSVRVFNQLGSLVHRIDRQNRIDLSALPSGMYTLQIQLSNDQFVVKKWMKE